MKRPKPRPLPELRGTKYSEHLEHSTKCKWCRSDHDWLGYYRLKERISLILHENKRPSMGKKHARAKDKTSNRDRKVSKKHR